MLAKTFLVSSALFAASDIASQARNALPTLIANGGLMIWVLIAASTVAILVFIERLLHYHRAQINSMEFLSGVRNVMKRDNVVEALSICDATPGPVARLVKVAILNRERGRDGVRESLEEAGLMEVPRLEEKLNVLATLAQIAPLLGLLGTVLGFLQIFHALQVAGTQANMEHLANGIWKALISMAGGIAVAIPCYAGYNYLVGRVNSIVLDMEKAASEIVNIVTENGRPEPAKAL
jgi:biopolymer transport protein ExbB